jgi:hypothetical protein
VAATATAELAAGTPARRVSVASRSRALALAPFVLLAAFLTAELVVCALRLTGPFLDEGIYISAGLRILDGHGLSDHYLTWFSGSLLWPAIAGLGWKLAGLAGARAAAAVCVTIGLAGATMAAGNLYGSRVRAAAALAAVTSGPVVALGHLAVYDTLAVAATGGAFWALTEFLRRDDRSWLCAAALLYALAGLAKYPALFFDAPPLVLLIVVTRGRKMSLDLGVFAFIVAATLLIYLLSFRAQLSAFESFRTQDNPTFNVTRAQLVDLQIYFTAVPLSLAIAGMMLVPRRRVGLALLSGVIGPPLYHLYTGNPSGDQKHVVFAILFMLPLIGVAVTFALRQARALAVLALVGLGFFAFAQVVRIDEGWPDLRPSASLLVHDVRPGEKLLASSSWVLAAYLYAHGRIDSPYDIYDVYRVEHMAVPPDLCSFQWFIEVPGGESWPTSIKQAVNRCDSFKRVFSSRARVTGLSHQLNFVTYWAPIEIYRNQTRPSARLSAVSEALRAGRAQ